MRKYQSLLLNCSCASKIFFRTERLGMAKLCIMARAVALREASFYKYLKYIRKVLRHQGVTKRFRRVVTSTEQCRERGNNRKSRDMVRTIPLFLMINQGARDEKREIDSRLILLIKLACSLENPGKTKIKVPIHLGCSQNL